MSTTVSNAVEKRTTTAATAVVEQYRRVFAETLPSHVKPETFIRVAQGALRKNPDLAAAAASNPMSLVSALLDAARLGLEPGTEQFYLVPLKGEVNGWTGYQGEIELIYRAGAVSSVIAEVVYTGDKFYYKPGMDRPDHEIDWDAENRGTLRLVYAYAQMKDGATSRPVVMNRAEVMKHKAMSKGSDRADSPWVKWEPSMWLKTAVHELAKWVPTSAEYLRDQARAAGEMVRTATKPTSAPPAPPMSVPTAGPVHVPQTTGERPAPPRGDVVDAEFTEDTYGDTPAEAGRPTTMRSGVRTITEQQMKLLQLSFSKVGITEEVGKHAYATEKLGRGVTTLTDLSTREASQLIDALKADANPRGESS